ncbi:MAG TPA: SRPBCC family protein [Gaiellaceae bacterium]|nr:SRPBCC family protein [Gaiellaceae bacterium]
MARSEASIEIARSADEVFPWLLDSDKRLQWVSGLVASEPLHDGRYRETMEQAGRRVGVTSSVVALEESRRLEVRTEGRGVTARIEHRLEPSGDGTRVTSSLDLKLGGLLRLAGGVAGAQAQRSLERSLARLKELLESS